MNSLYNTIELHKKNIDKSIFIEDMNDTHHSKLFEHAEYLQKNKY
jgi:hypothetical protein